MTQLRDGLLLATTAHGVFVAVKPETAERAATGVASPLNLETFQADPLWKTPGLDQQFFRINDILALPRADGDYDLYATHHYFTQACIEFRLSRTVVHVDGMTISQKGEWERLFTATPCFQVMKEVSTFYLPFSGNLSGGRMLDHDADRLLVTVGDQQVFEARGVDVAQDPSSTMGKILLIDKKTGAHEVFATGERNAQGLIRDSIGRIWETEHGPHGGDELNLVRAGDNLGWPKVTYGINYDQRPWPGAKVEGRHDGFRKPVYVWMPSVGISNLVEAPGDMFPNWRGDLLVGSLSGNTLFRVRLEGDDAIYAEPIRFGGRGMRDIEVMPDGRIAILDNRMSILQIRNAAGPGHSRIYNVRSSVVPQVTASLSGKRAALVAHGQTLFGRRCAECHSLVGAAGAGPQLRDVAGRHIGSEPEFTYSASLSGAVGTWNEPALTRFLLAPESFGAEVAMPNPGLSREEAQGLAAYLTELKKQDRRENSHRPAPMVHADGAP
jgi:aldose sugar dehydrogenase